MSFILSMRKLQVFLARVIYFCPKPTLSHFFFIYAVVTSHFQKAYNPRLAKRSISGAGVILLYALIVKY